MDDEITPLEQAQGILGEHFENYIIVVASEPHECEIEYNNSFAALGLLNTAHKIIADGLIPTSDENDVDIAWDDEFDDDEYS